MKNVVIICDDLFGIEVFSILQAINKYNAKAGKEPEYKVVGYVCDNGKLFEENDVLLPYLGKIEDREPVSPESYIMAILEPCRKEQIALLFHDKGAVFEIVFAPWVICPAAVKCGEGCIIAARSIKSDIIIGRFVTLIETMVSGHLFGDYSTALRYSNITGNVESRVYIGNHVYLHTGKRMEDDTRAVDGSIIIKNVKKGSTVSGVPASKIRTECFHMV